MWDKVKKDFGIVKSGTPVETEFKYLGDKQIKAVSGECGCTVLNFKDNIIKARLNLTLPEWSEENLYIKNINVLFTDGEKQVLSLRIKLKL